MFCSVLVMIGGIIRAATSYNIEATEAGLYLDGIANGLAFAPALALVGEVSMPFIRGENAATVEQSGFMVGFFVQIFYVSLWTNTVYSEFTVEQLQGILSAVYGLVALIFASLMCIESPVITLANGDEQAAIDLLRRLQRPATITNETYAQLEEHKRYLAQNKDLSTGQSIVRAIAPFIRLAYLRILNAMSLSTLMVGAVIISVAANPQSSYLWQYIIFALCRWLGTLIVGLCMESMGRKKPTLFGLLLVGGFAFGIASMLDDIPYGAVSSIWVLVVILQVFAAFAFTPTSAYLAESYPLGVKQHFIAFTFIVELLIFVIIGVTDYSLNGHVIYFYIYGTLCILGFIVGIFVLPETRGCTLREAQSKSTGILNQGF